MKKLIVSSAVVMAAVSANAAPNTLAMPTFYGSIKGSYVMESQKHSYDKFKIPVLSSPYTPATTAFEKGGNDLDFDSGTSIKFAFGVNAFENDDMVIRLEAEKAIFSDNATNDFDAFDEKGDIKIANVQPNWSSKNDTWFANAYIDWKATSSLRPYIGAGAGVNTMTATFSRQSGKFSVNPNSDTETAFAWHVGGGIAYHLTDKLAIDLGYRYSDLGDFNMKYYQHKTDFGIGTIYPESYFKHKVETQMHEVLLGARYSF